jgi:hypothetical protein
MWNELLQVISACWLVQCLVDLYLLRLCISCVVMLNKHVDEICGFHGGNDNDVLGAMWAGW